MLLSFISLSFIIIVIIVIYHTFQVVGLQTGAPKEGPVLGPLQGQGALHHEILQGWYDIYITSAVTTAIITTCCWYLLSPESWYDH